MTLIFDKDDLFKKITDDPIRMSEKFNLDMLVLRSYSGDDVGKSLNTVSARTSSIAELIAKDRDERDRFTTDVAFLLEQIRRLQTELAELDEEIQDLNEQIAELDEQISDIDKALARLEAGEDVKDVLESNPAAEDALKAYEERTGRKIGRDNADVVAFALEEERREMERQRGILVQQREDKEAKRELKAQELEASRARIEAEIGKPDGDLRAETAEGIDKVDAFAAQADMSDAEKTWRAAGKSDQTVADGIGQKELSIARADTEISNMRLTDEFKNRSALADGSKLELDFSTSMSAASSVENSPINAKPVKTAFNAEANGGATTAEHQPDELASQTTMPGVRFG